jgi:hypothetical protein
VSRAPLAVAAAAALGLLASCTVPVLLAATITAPPAEPDLAAACLGPQQLGQAAPAATGAAPQLTGLSGNASVRAQQYANARTIIAVGKAAGVGDRGVVIGLMTAMQESNLLNLNYGDRDSVGLFQQRPSSGWGTVAQLTTPSVSAGKFYAALAKVPGWQGLPLTEAAQQVQRSAFPTAYAKWEPLARSLYAALSGTPAALADVGAAGCWSDPGTAAAVAGSCPTGPNGQLPDSLLAPLPTAPGERLCRSAAAAFTAMDAAYAAQFGTHICVTDAYRSLSEQYAVKASRGSFAATPGSSDHGLGRALDLGCGINVWGSGPRTWMVAHAPGFGWHSPAWAQPGGNGPTEPWHWEWEHGK